MECVIPAMEVVLGLQVILPGWWVSQSCCLVTPGKSLRCPTDTLVTDIACLWVTNPSLLMNLLEL